MWLIALLTWTASLVQGPTVCREPNGRICRSHAAVIQFMKSTGHPHGWPGHVVDHVIPLCAGGPDKPANMQWQTIRAAKKKDIRERALCRKLHPGLSDPCR